MVDLTLDVALLLAELEEGLGGGLADLVLLTVVDLIALGLVTTLVGLVVGACLARLTAGPFCM